MNRHAIGIAALVLWVGMSGLALAADGASPLAAAAKRQDAATVRTLLRQKAHVNAPDAEGMTALHWAAHYNDLATVRALLAAGAKAAVANRYGVTPLHEAATLGNVAIVSALLRGGADADASYGDGETPLMIAARVGSLDTVRALIERGAKVNATEQFRGQTALMLAANENHAAVVKVLLDAGANANTRTREYDFQNLSGGADIDAVEPQYQFSPLQTAIFNGQYAFAKMLIEKGANVNDGALYVTMEMRNLAAYSNRPNPPEADKGISHLDIADLLLGKGANPNVAYTKTIPPRQAQGNINVPPGGTPLYRAVRAVDLAAVKLLLDRGANPGMAIGDGSAPVMAAAGLGAPRGGDEEVTEAGDRNDPVDVLKALVEKGADVNAVNDAGMTALHYAAQRGSDRIIQYLSAQGAKFDVKNKQGRMPADFARGKTAALVAELSGTPIKGPAAPAGARPAAPSAPSQR